MRILFLHSNFPAQFGPFAQYLWKQGWEVWFGTQNERAALDGVNIFIHTPHRDVSPNVHPYLSDFERAVIAGQSVARAGLRLADKGLKPDIVVAHSGWGQGLFARDIWPDAKYIGYFEWYYSRDAPDLAAEGASDRTFDGHAQSRVRNAPILIDLAGCDAGICPTGFQKAQFPECFQEKLHVIHDGIDTATFRPAPSNGLSLDGLEIPASREIITYVARGMEPYRGFPQFMKSLETILARRPNAHAVIVGEDRVAYGSKLPPGDSYKKRALAALDLDASRIHFTGLLSRSDYRKVLEASDVHVYLTAPFVLSWSLMEAMSAGCAIVASDVEPVRELAPDGEAAMIRVDMNQPREISDAIGYLLDNRAVGQTLASAARQIILDRYSTERLFPRKMNWLETVSRRD